MLTFTHSLMYSLKPQEKHITPAYLIEKKNSSQKQYEIVHCTSSRHSCWHYVTFCLCALKCFGWNPFQNQHLVMFAVLYCLWEQSEVACNWLHVSQNAFYLAFPASKHLTLLQATIDLMQRESRRWFSLSSHFCSFLSIVITPRRVSIPRELLWACCWVR